MGARFFRSSLDATGANANILIRLVVGGVLLSEGLLKFNDPAANAAGRFAAIGRLAPGFVGRGLSVPGLRLRRRRLGAGTSCRRGNRFPN